MAVQRNNLARLPWPVREVACRTMFDGATNDEVDAAVRSACQREGVETREIHNSTILAYRKSAEYTDYCERRRANQAEQDEARMMWAAIGADQGASSAVQAARYLALREIVQQLQTGDLSPNDTSRLTQSLARLSGDVLDEAKREWQAERAALEQQHEADLAKLQKQLDEAKAEIERLTAELAGVGEGKGLKPDTIENIERRLKLL